MRSALLVILVIGLFSCDPCSDCGLEVRPPYIEISFFDDDRLLEVTDSLSLINTLQDYADSLIVVVDSIENHGRPLESEKLEFEMIIDGLTTLRANKTDTLFAEALDSVETLLKKNNSNIKNGRTAIDLLTIEGTGYSSSLDSLKSHNIPLVINAEQTLMALIIDDEEFSINVEYTLYDEMDEDNVVRRKAFIESINHTGFDEFTCLCADEEVSCSAYACEAENSSMTCRF